MIVSNPYMTSYGKLINKDKIVKDINKYLIVTNNTNFNYEYVNGEDCNIVFITGCEQDERDIPMWNQPMVCKTMRDDNMVVVDMRKYVKSVDSQPESLDSIIKDHAGSRFLINSSIIISDFVSENYGEYRGCYNSAVVSYSLFISYIVDSIIKLNPVEKLDVEIALSYFANGLLTPGEDLIEYKDSIINRISNTKLSLPITKNNIKSIVDKLADMNISFDIKGMVEVIRCVLGEDKGELITESLIVNMLSNMWYGPGSNETLVMALECMPMWIALVYGCLDDNTYKRTKLSMVLEKFNKNIAGKEMCKKLELILKNKRMGLDV